MIDYIQNFIPDDDFSEDDQNSETFSIAQNSSSETETQNDATKVVHYFPSGFRQTFRNPSDVPRKQISYKMKCSCKYSLTEMIKLFEEKSLFDDRAERISKSNYSSSTK